MEGRENGWSSRWKQFLLEVFSHSSQSQENLYKIQELLQSDWWCTFPSIWRSTPFFHRNHIHLLPFPTLNLETNTEKHYANLSQIRNAGRSHQKGLRWHLRQWGAGEKRILGHVLTWVFCGSQQGPQNNSEGNPASQGIPGSSTQKTTKFQATAGILWGSQRKISYRSLWKTYMPCFSNLLWFVSSCS